MRWSNEMVKFIVTKIQGYGTQVYFYTVDKDIITISTATNIDKRVVILLREDIAVYLNQLEHNFILKVSPCDSGVKVVIKDGVLSE